MKTHTFHIQGMHCNACILLTENELEDVSYITKAKSSLHNHTVEITGEFGDKSIETLAEELTHVLQKHGYTLSTEKKTQPKGWSDFKIAIPMAITFAILFLLLQKLGLVNLVGGGETTYGTAFVIGVIASLSTCMAVVGGLLLSLSATFAKDKNTLQPHILFHVGRLASFFLLGGVIGAIGSAFTLTSGATFVISIIVGLVMLTLGINLLDVFPWAKKLQPHIPQFIAQRAHGVSRYNYAYTPALVGIATFFLPCGFTQSMQVYTLTTGSFLAGGLTMFAFALGTLPVLSLISFGTFSIQNSPRSGIFFKTAGLIVIMFAIFNLANSAVVVGLLPPFFNF